LRGAACDLCSGSGLTANRINLPNASELYPAFDGVSRSPRPALCYRPLLAFSRHFAVRERLCSSPGRRTNRKNLRNCQRTSMFLLLLFLESTKTVRFYPVYFQASAAGSQAGARIWCSWRRLFLTEVCSRLSFAIGKSGRKNVTAFERTLILCISLESLAGQGVCGRPTDSALLGATNGGWQSGIWKVRA